MISKREKRALFEAIHDASCLEYIHVLAVPAGNREQARS
jgi:hypothetical protein